MPTKQMSAVDWLYETLWKQTDYSLPSNILEQAKAIYKQQIIDAYRKGFISDDIKLADDYYNETYKETI
jgi:hypothetical protein